MITVELADAAGLRKRCTQCGHEKPLGQFYFNKRWQRHFAECADCNCRRRRQRRLAEQSPRSRHYRSMRAAGQVVQEVAAL